MPGYTAKEVDQHLLTQTLAIFLKKSGKLTVPEEVEVIKTAKYKETAPDEADWFYTRCASVLRHMYHRHHLGVGALTKIYGGRKRNGVQPAYFCRGAEGISRKVMQSLESAGLIEKHADGGRKLTASGQRDLDRIANQIVIKLRERNNRSSTLIISE